jgi:hypothetical protein
VEPPPLPPLELPFPPFPLPVFPPSSAAPPVSP